MTTMNGLTTAGVDSQMQTNDDAMNMTMDQVEAVAAVTGVTGLPALLPAESREPAAGPADADDVHGLLAAIRRLEAIIEEETIALRTGKKIDFDEFSTRKSRGMLEFVRLMRGQLHLGAEAEVTEQIQKLRGRLERNRAVLEMHYDAVREVAEIIVGAIREAESDGTYSARAAQESK